MPRGAAEGCALRPHPDRRRGRLSFRTRSSPSWPTAAGWRGAGQRGGRAPDHRPQSRRRVRLSFHWRCRRTGPAGVRSPAIIHFLRKGRASASQASLRDADRVPHGRNGERRHAARRAGLGLPGQSDADRAARSAKATDANVAIARAAGRPQLNATAGLNRNLTRSGVIAQTQGNDHNISLSGGVDLSLPLFTGGRVRTRSRPPRPASRPAARRCAPPRATSSPRRSPPIWT